MKKALVIVSIFCSIISFSQSKKKNENSIDLLEVKCLNGDNMSGFELCACTTKARESWDKELNKYYGLLKAKLPKEAFETLKESQKQWIIYRDKEYSFIEKFYYEVKQGTMYYSFAETRKKEIVKARAIELKGYHESLLDLDNY